ncbi:MAG: ParA family protein [Solobacterium sp.]|nr:ParA family protein [Solobacterium sp.]
MKVITFANYTGGAGKSTSSTAMATILKQMGFRTLFIDADKQRNSTGYMNCNEPNALTLYDVMDQHRPLGNIREAIQHCDTCDVIAGDTMLDTLNSQLALLNKKIPFSGMKVLKNALSTISDEYDYCVIDTSYVVDEILFAVMAATDEIIVPLDVDVKAIQGFANMNEDIKKVRAEVNPGLKVKGCLLTRINPNLRVKNTDEFRTAAEVFLRQIDPTLKLFGTMIRTTEFVRASHNKGESLILKYPKSNAAQDYTAFVKEYLETATEE